ncbi:DNA cross-link repair protein SNM1 [Euphorbia lathyris]|uniref:DNA cross-link repair protein SNM1 n=1 Tax=Euphorbia lathyris TaxID=212925 RepID=UPI003313D406
MNVAAQEDLADYPDAWDDNLEWPELMDDVVLDERKGSYEFAQEEGEEHLSIRQEEKRGDGEEETFAADFYRSGTDWSCLLPADGHSNANNHHTQRKLKQGNLFDIWGLKNSKPPITSPPPPKKLKTQIGPLHSNTAFAKSTESVQKNRPRLCPFYKRIPGTPFSVDAFRYGSIQGCSAYFLTHFHYDHYGGLTKGWSHGPIHCTPLTARLLKLCLSINSSFIRPLELDTEYVIEEVRVTLLEANHCPGAALIHFRLPTGVCYLHTGDFRASKLMESYHLLLNHRINVLYLDTTYCNPKYKFPSKEYVLNYVVGVTKEFLKRQPKTLVVVGAYSIGKECVYLAISKALGAKIYASASRRRILESFGSSDFATSLCKKGEDTLLHVLPISSLRFESLKNYLKQYKNQFTSVLAFRPTGWTYSESVGKQLDLIRPNSKGNVTIYGVPYSEHSSFTEMKEFVQFLKPDKIIPTVNVGNPANRDKMQSYFREWLKG